MPLVSPIITLPTITMPPPTATCAPLPPPKLTALLQVGPGFFVEAGPSEPAQEPTLADLVTRQLLDQLLAGAQEFYS